MRTRIFTFKEFNTLLANIKVIINSRSLTVLSSDPNELSCLTYSHFVIGDT